MTQHIIPFIWLFVLFVGTIVTLLNLVASMDDRRQVRVRWPNHTARKRVADGSVRNQAIILTIMVLFIMAGIVGWYSTPPRTMVVSLLLYGGLIGGVALLGLLSILERVDRSRLM